MNHDAPFSDATDLSYGSLSITTPRNSDVDANSSAFWPCLSISYSVTARHVFFCAKRTDCCLLCSHLANLLAWKTEAWVSVCMRSMSPLSTYHEPILSSHGHSLDMPGCNLM
jgi:hypothetical protein